MLPLRNTLLLDKHDSTRLSVGVRVSPPVCLKVIAWPDVKPTWVRQARRRPGRRLDTASCMWNMCACSNQLVTGLASRPFSPCTWTVLWPEPTTNGGSLVLVWLNSVSFLDLSWHQRWSGSLLCSVSRACSACGMCLRAVPLRGGRSLCIVCTFGSFAG